MDDVVTMLSRWGLEVGQVRRRIDRAPDARERERWHALGRLAQGWSAATVAEALERAAPPLGAGVAAFRAQGPPAVSFDRTGGSPRRDRR